MGTGICCGCRSDGTACGNTELIQAHIVAKCFAKEIRGAYRHNWLISDQRVSHTQLGIWDDGILCATCDGTLGDLENYALSVCRRFPSEHTVRRDSLFEGDAIGRDRSREYRRFDLPRRKGRHHLATEEAWARSDASLQSSLTECK